MARRIRERSKVMGETRYSFRVDPSPEGGWVVWFPDLPGCSGWAEHADDIGNEAETIRTLWLESETTSLSAVSPMRQDCAECAMRE